MEIELGCFTRPWGEAGLSFDEALAGIAAAGYERVGLPPLRAGGALLPADVTEADLDALRARIAAHGLTPHVAFGNPDLSLRRRQAIAQLRREMEYAHSLGLKYLLLTGTEDEKQYDDWFRAVAGALEAARDLGLTLLLKPHGGLSALAEDLLRALDRLHHHPSFGLCYDPGNIYYYTGRRAREDLPKVAPHVRALCIKDEIGGRRGQVMITPGTGLVDFRSIFALLADAGFSGPCWVEGLGGRTLQEIDRDAATTLTFIARLTENA